MGILKNHFQCSKHKIAVEKLKNKELRENDIARSLLKYNDTEVETLPQESISCERGN